MLLSTNAQVLVLLEADCRHKVHWQRTHSRQIAAPFVGERDSTTCSSNSYESPTVWTGRSLTGLCRILATEFNKFTIWCPFHFNASSPHHKVQSHQIYGYCQPAVSHSRFCIDVCIDEVSTWINANRLQLNPAKSEVLWCASPWHQHLIPTEYAGHCCQASWSLSMLTSPRWLKSPILFQRLSAPQLIYSMWLGSSLAYTAHSGPNY